MGTPQELTDEQGNIIWANYEFAWGGRYTHFYKEQSLNNCDILEHELQPIRFQGQFFDTETSLHYNRFRYYDTDVGMFISRDPIELMGGFNVFAYAPNPIHWIDPWGLANESVYRLLIVMVILYIMELQIEVRQQGAMNISMMEKYLVRWKY